MVKPSSEVPPAELEVLAALWRIGSGTVRDVLAELEKEGRRLAYTTVLTLLGRLEARGCVAVRKTAPAHVYRPRVRRDEVLRDRLGTLVRQLGEGNATPLILELVKAHKLTRADIRELKDLLAKLDRGAPDQEKG